MSQYLLEAPRSDSEAFWSSPIFGWKILRKSPKYSTVESSRTSLASTMSSRTHFEVLGLEEKVLALEASSPQKLPCFQLEDSTIFWTVEILLKNARNRAENLRGLFLFLNWRSPEKNILKTFSLEKNFWRTFFLRSPEKILDFFLLDTCAWVLSPWPRAFLSLASRRSVLERAVLGLDLDFFCVFGSLALASSLVSSTLPLVFCT